MLSFVVFSRYSEAWVKLRKRVFFAGREGRSSKWLLFSLFTITISLHCGESHSFTPEEVIGILVSR
jgi:hypothetical protein